MAQLLQAGRRHYGTSLAQWVHGHLTVEIMVCAFRYLSLLLQIHLKRLGHPEVPQTRLWTGAFSTTVEKAGNFVKHMPFGPCLQPTGLQKQHVHEPTAATGSERSGGGIRHPTVSDWASGLKK